MAIALAVVPQVNYITGSMTNPSGAYIMEIFKLEEDVTMVPVIDKRKTGEECLLHCIPVGDIFLTEFFQFRFQLTHLHSSILINADLSIVRYINVCPHC